MQITKLVIPAVPMGKKKAFPHGLVRTPDLAIFSANETDPNIEFNVTPFDAVNVYLNNGGAAPAPAAVLVMALHSIMR